MPNGNNDVFTTVEIAPFADDLELYLGITIYEDELGEVVADRIVFGEETYHVKVCWKLTGKLARHFCGQWLVKLDLESIGTAAEYSSECYPIPMEPCMDEDEEYCYTFDIGPDDLETPECGTVYYPAVTLSTLDPCGNPGHMWGYATGPSVMFTPAEPHIPVPNGD